MSKSLGIAVVVLNVLVLALLGGLYLRPAQVQVVQVPVVGAASGGTFTNPVEFLDGARAIGFVRAGASSTISPNPTTSTAITAAKACDSSFVSVSASTTGASTLNLPTAEAMFKDCLTTNGDVRELYVRNLTASTTVVTAGSASTTIAYDGSTGGSVTLAGSSWAHLRFIRMAFNAMVVIMDQYKF